VKDLRSPAGLDNLLYSADTYFSCFADLALTSPVEYFKEGQGSLMQCVITPAAPYMPWTNEAIAAETDKQVGKQGGGEGGVYNAALLWHVTQRVQHIDSTLKHQPPVQALPVFPHLRYTSQWTICCTISMTLLPHFLDQPLSPDAPSICVLCLRAGAPAVPQCAWPQHDVAQHREDRAVPVP
jgi:uncharacterized protein with NAD-binding domain and iron-sulfur cluster